MLALVMFYTSWSMQFFRVQDSIPITTINLLWIFQVINNALVCRRWHMNRCYQLFTSCSVGLPQNEKKNQARWKKSCFLKIQTKKIPNPKDPLILPQLNQIHVQYIMEQYAYLAHKHWLIFIKPSYFERAM